MPSATTSSAWRLRENRAENGCVHGIFVTTVVSGLQCYVLNALTPSVALTPKAKLLAWDLISTIVGIISLHGRKLHTQRKTNTQLKQNPLKAKCLKNRPRSPSENYCSYPGMFIEHRKNFYYLPLSFFSFQSFLTYSHISYVPIVSESKKVIPHIITDKTFLIH